MCFGPRFVVSGPDEALFISGLGYGKTPNIIHQVTQQSASSSSKSSNSGSSSSNNSSNKLDLQRQREHNCSNSNSSISIALQCNVMMGKDATMSLVLATTATAATTAAATGARPATAAVKIFHKGTIMSFCSRPLATATATTSSREDACTCT